MLSDRMIEMPSVKWVNAVSLMSTVNSTETTDQDANMGTAFSLWGLLLLLLCGLSLTCYILHNTPNVIERRTEWNGRKLSSTLQKMSDHEHEIFLYKLQDSPYVGDDYLYPGGLYGLPPGMAEDFLRLICNYHTLFSTFLVDDNNSFQHNQKNALYFYVACFGFLLFSFTSLMTRGDTPQTIVNVINIFLVNPALVFMAELAYIFVACPCCTSLEKDGRARGCARTVEVFSSTLIVLIGMFAYLFVGAITMVAPSDKDSGVSLADASGDAFWQFIVYILIFQAVTEIFSFMLMFIDITDGSCKGHLFSFIHVMTCRMMRIGVWYKSRREALQLPDTGSDVKMPATSAQNDVEDIPPVVQGTIYQQETRSQESTIPIVVGTSVVAGQTST